MTEFQKIAIGLLGLTHPELFNRRSRAGQGSATSVESANRSGSHRSVRPGQRRLIHAVQGLRFALAALSIGSRTVALADNSQLRRDLAACAGLVYGAGED